MAVDGTNAFVLIYYDFGNTHFQFPIKYVVFSGVSVAYRHRVSCVQIKWTWSLMTKHTVYRLLLQNGYLFPVYSLTQIVNILLRFVYYASDLPLDILYITYYVYKEYYVRRERETVGENNMRFSGKLIFILVNVDVWRWVWVWVWVWKEEDSQSEWVTLKYHHLRLPLLQTTDYRLELQI